MVAAIAAITTDVASYEISEKTALNGRFFDFWSVQLFFQYPERLRQRSLGGTVIARVVFSLALIAQAYDLCPFRWRKFSARQRRVDLSDPHRMLGLSKAYIR